MPGDREVVLVPLKSFAHGKSRLRARFGSDWVEELSRRLARGVIESCAPRPCWVVGDDPVVLEFAHQNGARALETPETDLNGAVQHAYGLFGAHSLVIVAHADLAHPEGLGEFRFGRRVTVVTDRHGRGTNVLALPGGTNYHFCYGDDSARRHLEEASRIGLQTEVISDSPWGRDLDEPEDLEVTPT